MKQHGTARPLLPDRNCILRIHKRLLSDRTSLCNTCGWSRFHTVNCPPQHTGMYMRKGGEMYSITNGSKNLRFSIFLLCTANKMFLLSLNDQD